VGWWYTNAGDVRRLVSPKWERRFAKMAKYLMLWELDETKIPANPKERAAAWAPLVERVRQNMKQGSTKAWGSFAGETRGFAIHEGDDMTVSMHVQQFLPFVTFNIYPFISIDQMEELIKNLQK
jgi:hypothetical protein